MVKQIGRHEVRAELGRGGFGTVYRAFDPKVGREVAIKTLSAHGDPELITRFRNEAASAGQLHHKNIVTIYDFGEQDGEPFIVMELLGGMDLQRVIAAERPLSLLQKMQVMDQVAEGLRHAHEKGVVHRDVKPANMMLLPDSSVKIMDFGIALIAQAANTRLTKAGTVPGTLRYMAPEQFRGESNDFASDIFAYGVTYYELLSYRHPFEAPTQPALMYRIMNEEPASLRSLIADCPEALEQVLARALHKDRDQRYQAFEDLQLDLRPLMLELQQVRSRQLTTQATAQASAGDIESAQAAVREALDLDPANREAVQLRRSLQQDAQRRFIKPRVEALLNASKDLLTSRKFEEAIANLESAIQLDQYRTDVQALLNTARTSLKSKRKAEGLSTEAQRCFETGDLNAAFERADEALRSDPTNPGIQTLVHRIRSEIDVRARAARLEGSLRSARSALLAKDFPQALSLLSAAAAEFPNHAEVASLLAEATQAKVAAERQAEFERRITAARDLLGTRRFAEAVEEMDSIAAKFPGFPQVQELLDYARQQHQVQRRTDHLARLEKEVHAHLAAGRVDAAVEMAQKGLAVFPNEELTRSLLQSAEAACNEQARQQAFQALVQNVQALEQQQRLAEAIHAVSTFEETHGSIQESRILRDRLETANHQLTRKASVRQTLDHGSRLIQDSNYSKAVEVLASAAAKHPDSGEIDRLLQEARHKLQEQRRTDDIERIIGNATELTRTHSFDQALNLVQSALTVHPDAVKLQRAHDQARAAKQEHDLQQATRQIREALGSEDIDEALRLANSAITRFPNHPDLEELQTRAREEKQKRNREKAIAQAVQTGRRLSASGTPAEASAFVEDALRNFPGEPALTALKFRLDTRLRELDTQKLETERKASLEALNQAIAEERLQDALQGIQKHMGRFGEDPDLHELRRLIEDAQTRQRRKQQLDNLHREALALRERGEYAQALELLQQSNVATGEHIGVSSLLDLLRRRAGLIEEALTEAKTALQSGNPARAEAVLSQTLRRYPDCSQIPPVLQQAKALAETQRREQEQRQREAALRQAHAEAQSLLAQGEPERAVAVLETAMQDHLAKAELAAALQEANAHVQRKRQEEQERAHAKALDEKRRQTLLEVERLETQANATPQPEALQELLWHARQAAAAYPGDPAFAAPISRIESQAHARSQPSPALPPAAPAPAPPTSRPAFHYALAGLLLILASGGAYLALRPSPSAPAPEAKTEPAPQPDPLPPTPPPPVTIPTETAKKIETPPPTGQPTGQLRIATALPGVDVYLNGSLRGRTDSTGTFDITLDAKRYALELKRDGYRSPPTQNIDIRTNQPESLNLTLAPLDAQLQFEGGTPGSQVKLADGSPVGTIGNDGRLNARVPPGRQLLQVTKDQFALRTISRDLRPGESVTIGANEIALTPVPKADPQLQLAQEWDRLKGSQDVGAIEDFLKRSRGSAFASLAEIRIDDLRWSLVSQKEPDSLSDFAKRFPASRHRSEALTLAESLRNRQEMDRLRTAQTQQEGKKQEPPAAVAAAEKKAILAALERYEKAFSSKNGQELKAAWPNIPVQSLKALNEGLFKSRGTEVRMKLLAQGDPELRGNTAVINCVESTITIANGRPSEPALRPAKISLTRSGGGWVIDAITR